MLTSAKKAALGSFVGTSIEWYDFFIYGTASALVFRHVFFPSHDPLVGTLLSFATFGVAFTPGRWAGSSSATSEIVSAAGPRSS